MEIRAEEISQVIKEQIKGFDKKVELSETGVVLSVGDGIARVYGLMNVMVLELVEFPGGILGLAMNLEEDSVGVAVMGDDRYIKEGDIVKRTGRIAEIPVGEGVLGRVIDTTGVLRWMVRARLSQPKAVVLRWSLRVLSPERAFMSR